MIDRVGGGFRDYSPLMLRLGLATIFIINGARSIPEVGNPSLERILTLVIMLLGGLFCLIGFLTRWAAFALGGLMAWKILGGPRFEAFVQWHDQIYFACLMMCGALYGLGGGKLSLDEKMKKKGD